jgi:RNA polymerase sigma factor (sigma-70 family)
MAAYELANKKSNDRIHEISQRLQTNITEAERNELAMLIYPKLKHYIWTFCKNEFDTTEALQWSIKRIFRNSQLFDFEKGRFTTWIFRIARNETLYYLHQKKKTTHTDVEPIMHKIDRPDESGDSILMKNDMEEIYTTTVDAIYGISDVVLRGIAIDKMIHHKMVRDIAVDYGLNENTVKTKLRKIRTDLRYSIIKANPQFEDKIKQLL